jgi:hypothetical protein
MPAEFCELIAEIANHIAVENIADAADVRPYSSGLFHERGEFIIHTLVRQVMLMCWQNNDVS